MEIEKGGPLGKRKEVNTKESVKKVKGNCRICKWSDGEMGKWGALTKGRKMSEKISIRMSEKVQGIIMPGILLDNYLNKK